MRYVQIQPDDLGVQLSGLSLRLRVIRCHDDALDPLALEAANHAAQASDAGPVKTLHQGGQLRRGVVADADADHGQTQAAGFFREHHRKSAT